MQQHTLMAKTYVQLYSTKGQNTVADLGVKKGGSKCRCVRSAPEIFGATPTFYARRES